MKPDKDWVLVSLNSKFENVTNVECEKKTTTTTENREVNVDTEIKHFIREPRIYEMDDDKM